MIEHYTLKQAMDRLGLRSTNAILQLMRKHPEVFVNVNPNPDRARKPWYGKVAFEGFCQVSGRFKQETR